DESLYGIILMFGYLFCDGFTSSSQERLFKGYTMSKENQMIYVNLSSAILSMFTLLSMGTLDVAIKFAVDHPALLTDALSLSVCATSGQQVIYHIIQNYGALVFATAMVSRQVIQIIVSTIVYAHP